MHHQNELKFSHELLKEIIPCNVGMKDTDEKLTVLFMFHDAMKIRNFLLGKTRNSSVSLMRGEEPMLGAEEPLEEAL